MLNTDTEDILKRIQKILARIMKLKESAITIDAHLRDDLGVDSVDLGDIVCQMEEAFGINVEEKDVRGIDKVQDILNVVKSKIDAAKGK